MAEIYALCHPTTREVRYIGKANDSAKRLKSHLRDMRTRDYPVYRWMRKLAASGLCPVVKVLETTENWREAEMRLIEQSRARGDRLLNVADGGDEPACSPETRSANGRALNAMLRANPLQAKLRDLKRLLMTNIRQGRGSNYTRLSLRASADANPKLFGLFADIQFLPQEGTHARRA